MRLSLGFIIAGLIATIFISEIADANLTRRKNRSPHSKGLQIKSGFFSGTPQGEIPSVFHMISSLILNPLNGGKVQAGKHFNIVVQTRNLVSGHFSDPANGTYYTKPQALHEGNIVGHSHITIQSLGSGHSDPDPVKFTFFKGLEETADKKGIFKLKADPINKPGLYRICTMTSSFTHQPVLMPVAKRGAQDDCIRFTVVKHL